MGYTTKKKNYERTISRNDGNNSTSRAKHASFETTKIKSAIGDGTPLRTLHTCNGSLMQTQPVEEMNWDLARMTSH